MTSTNMDLTCRKYNMDRTPREYDIDRMAQEIFLNWPLPALVEAAGQESPLVRPWHNDDIGHHPADRMSMADKKLALKMALRVRNHYRI